MAYSRFSQICIDSYIVSGIFNYNDNDFYSYIFHESRNRSENESSSRAILKEVPFFRL